MFVGKIHEMMTMLVCMYNFKLKTIRLQLKTINNDESEDRYIRYKEKNVNQIMWNNFEKNVLFLGRYKAINNNEQPRNGATRNTRSINRNNFFCFILWTVNTCVAMVETDKGNFPNSFVNWKQKSTNSNWRAILFQKESAQQLCNFLATWHPTSQRMNKLYIYRPCVSYDIQSAHSLSLSLSLFASVTS